MKPRPQRSEVLDRDMAGRCLCFGVRKAARVVTQIYDEAFRPLGLKSTQATLLFMIHAMGPVALSRLARHAVMDRTSLTRNLRPLERAKLVAVEGGEDARVRLARLTEEGARRVTAALPLWDELQARMAGALGDLGLKRVLGELDNLVETVRSREPRGPRSSAAASRP